MSNMGEELKVKGIIVLMRKNVLDLMDFNVSLLLVLDGVQDFLGQRVSFQLVSATVGDPNNGNKGVVGKPAYLEESIPSLESTTKGESVFELTFSWEESEGIPGAVVVKSNHHDQFFLKSLTFEDFPGKGRLHFSCNSWVYPVDKYSYDRIFFVNDTCLPENTPGPLKPYRQEELRHLRGGGVDRKLEEWDRVYDYAFYNDLGDPDRNPNLVRPVLGGSEHYPYPRRGRTGRPPTRTDPNSESRLPLLDLDIYVPRDERFGHIKTSDFLGSAIKALVQSLVPILGAIFDETPNEFDSFQDVLKMYEGGLELPKSPAALIDAVKDNMPFESIKTIVSTREGKSILSLPLPQVIEADKFAWRTDEEFAREMMAGVNPVMIGRLREFPPSSKLDPSKYGNQNSSITAAHIEKNIDGLSVEQALSSNRLFILDHHDTLMPYLNRINSTLSKVYATRTLLFLRADGTLKPLAIELSLPSPQGEQHCAVSKVFTPTDVGVEGSVWQLAKAYVAVNDSGIHQLISHWLNTHATVEPFVIATHRNLSTLHPINKLLVPHYRDTMNINALARQTLINAGGILELTVFPAKYAMEMSAVVYKGWKFTEHALPVDLLKRGVAVEDPNSPNNIRLLIKDYPYAVDGMIIWSAIETWVSEYCSIYYPDDAAVESDAELQAWWEEVREVGHGDKNHEPWWPEMRAVSDLTRSCTTIIWVASALHAAVNFGQYPYAGYLPNRPTISRRFMPEPGSDAYELLRAEPDKAFLRTITSQLQTVLGVSLIEILSTHASDEVYLGQRDTPEWTSDRKALDAFERFGAKVGEIEKSILAMNRDPGLPNRDGPVEMPYTLLFPTSSGGLTGKGIPNSVSI